MKTGIKSAILLSFLLFFFSFLTVDATEEAGFSFAVVGDLQQPPGQSAYQPVSHKIMEKIAADKSDFVIIVGDLVFDDNPNTDSAHAQWQAFDRLIEPVRKAGKPVYAVPGNHDMEHPDLARGFVQRFGARYRYFVHKKVVFVLLNSEATGTSVRNWDLGEEQTEWLNLHPWRSSAGEASLSFVFLHRPIYRSEIMKLDPIGSYGRNKPGLARDFARLGFSAVFSGHEHLFFHRRIHEMDFYTTGGGGAPLLPTGYYHYLLAQVDATGTNYRVEIKKIKR